MVSLAVVGATGAVGREATRLLETLNIDFERVEFFASAKSVEAKRRVTFKNKKMYVKDLALANFREFAFAIFAVESDMAKHYAPLAQEAGCIVIDNSSAFRMEKTVPLVVPEINAHALRGHSGIIANPNCTTAITLMALYPLHKAFEVERVSVTSYQAASGAGDLGLLELQAELCSYNLQRGYAEGKWDQKMHSNVFPQPIALNVFPHIGTFLSNRATDEEMKVLNEGRKILEHPKLRASTTCVRVPVERVHCMDVLAQFDRDIDMQEAHRVLAQMPGLDLFTGDSYPTPLMYAGKYNCAVARVRIDEAFPNALRFWVLGDQLLKGAALNSVQIFQELIK